ncbi:MAG: VWA domain-containing protein, partial [Deltaproteobacteria bacterium]|nr:VWA domain-containing protein [Deltaproteobacteria bacterium]
MSFLNPNALFLLLLLPAVVLLYLLRYRRRPLVISSTMLLEAVEEEHRANAILRRFRHDPLLWLQLLALAALVLGFARPLLTIRGVGQEQLILVLDTSASMKATDVRPSRWAEAQRKALDLVGGMKAGGQAMVIEASSVPRVVAPLTADRTVLRRVLRELKPHDLPSNIEEAVLVARAQVKANPGSRIYVLTDGAYELSPDAAKDPEIRWLPFGTGGENVGITGLSVRRAFYAAYDYQALVSLVNYGERPQGFTLRVFQGSRRIGEQAISLAPKVKRSVLFPFTSAGGETIRAEIDADDDLETDNRAFAVLPLPRKRSVLLVSPGNAFIEKALKADPQLQVEVQTPDAYKADTAHDITIFDSFAPEKIPEGRYIFVHAVPKNLPVEVLGKVDNPPIIDWDRRHPVLKYVDLSKVAIEEALRVRPLLGSRTLVESRLTPLVFLYEERRLKFLFFSFDLVKSDLPLRVAFPILLSNALHWLYPVAFDDALQVKAGRPFTLPVDPGIREVTVTTPDGGSARVGIEKQAVIYSATDRVGVYTLRGREGIRQFAVNLLDEEESNLRPRASFTAGERVQAGPTRGAFELRRELWSYLAALALGLLLLEAVLYVLRRRQAVWLPVWVALRVLVIACVALALVRPTVLRAVDRMTVLFLVDQSASLARSGREAALGLVARALKTMQKEDRAGVITFGQTAILEVPPQEKPPLPRLPAAPAQGTNISQAIRLALATFPPGTSRRIVLLSDGNETKGSAVETAQFAKNAGVDIYPVPLAPAADEVMVERVILPQEVKVGEPFALRVVAWSVKEGQGMLHLYRNGRHLGSQRVSLQPGKNVLSYNMALETVGFQVYNAVLEADADTWLENNQAIGVTAVRGKPSVLYIERDIAQGEHLARALRSQNIDVEMVRATNLANLSAIPQKFDAVILGNVSSLRLTRKQMEMLRDYVRDQGGGLLMLGGDESFGLGGYYRTPIEEALPVTMESQQKIEVPTLAMALVIDRSGSMDLKAGDVTKLDLAKEAAQLAVELLDDRSEVGVIAFDTEFTWVVSTQPARDKDKILREIASIKSGGGTDLYPAMKEAYTSLFQRKSILKHIIVISDGQVIARDFQRLVRSMAKDKITVSTVAVGRDADLPLMMDMAKWGKGRWYYTEDAQGIPRIFTMETQLASKTTLVEEPFRPVAVNPGHEILQEIDWQRVPPLGGYLATTAKPTADVLLASHQGEPVLAVWRYGLGRAAAFTSDAKARWAILWLRWGGFNKFFSQMVRWTLRSSGKTDLTAVAATQDGQAEVLVEATNDRGEFINFLDLQMGVINPGREGSAVNLEQIGPGRYRGTFETKDPGAYLIAIAQRKGQRVTGSQISSVVVPPSPELQHTGTNHTLLKELADVTGGRVVSEKADVFALNRRRSQQPFDIWPYLLLGGLALFLLDIVLRRLSFLGLLSRRAAAGPVLALALAAGALLASGWATPALAGEPAPPRPPARVAVLPFTNVTAPQQGAWLGRALSEGLIHALAQLRRVRTIDPAVLQKLLAAREAEARPGRPERATVLQLAQALRADEVLAGEVEQR